jgi:quercetin dioxygenase-like cupin family protein
MNGVRRGSLAGARADEPFPGVRRRSFDSDRATVTSYSFEPGARFPLHRHREEQITLVEEGEIEFVVDGGTERLRAGDWTIVGPDVEHGVVAGPDGARFLAIVVPRRSEAPR